MVIFAAFLSMLDKDSGLLLRRVVLASFPPSGDHSFVTLNNNKTAPEYNRTTRPPKTQSQGGESLTRGHVTGGIDYESYEPVVIPMYIAADPAPS